MAEVVVKFGADTADFSSELAIAQRLKANGYLK